MHSNHPPWQTACSHFRRMRIHGTWQLINTALHRAERERVGRNPDPSADIMDSQSVKTVEESAHIRGYDAHKCVKGRKRHLLVDTLGLPIAWYVTPADLSDPQGARRLLGGLAFFVPRRKHDLGGCCLSRQRVGRLVPAAGHWLGPGDRGTGSRYSWLPSPTAQVGR